MSLFRGVLPWALVLVGLLTLSGCSDNRAKAWQMIDDGALLVDVRSPGEYNAGHLPDAKLIPVSEVGSRLAEFGNDKNAPIVVYCAAGVRAGKAKDILESNGFTNVVNGGGYEDMMAAKPK
ncbi:MAG: rhodanese-like domain-containing protein [Gammaproteobacteria bacterium]|nr:rhodanese-like domain-containing protein [Gammaproteobacteria bacterium]